MSRAYLIGGFMPAPALALLIAVLAAASAGVPVRVMMDQPGLATVVVESTDGTRVANLIAEMPLTAGRHTFPFDLYEVGSQAHQDKPYVRRRIAPGTYRVRGLTFDHITPKYEFSVYSQGTPPWSTDDGTGGWMADHTPPSDALFLPANHRLPWGKGQPVLILTAALAESGKPTVYTDLNGKVLMSHGLCGKTVARDVGTNVIAEHAVYFANSRESFSGRLGLFALKPDGSTVRLVSFEQKAASPMPEEQWFVDVAVRDGVAVISNSENRDNLNDITGNLQVVDLRTGKTLANHQTAPTRGVAFGPDRKLYVLIDGALHRFTFDPQTGALSDDTVLVKDLVDPRRVRFDAKGDLYVSGFGAAHQIRVYNRTGQLLRTIGKPGGLQMGAYDERRMQRPDGFTFDDRGRLWLAENCMTPKRISLWQAADGSFLRAIYGRVAYGGGGTIDPADPTRFYYPCWTDGTAMLFRLDWKAGTWKPESIYYRSPHVSRDWARRKEGTNAPFLATQYLMDCDPPLVKWNAIPQWAIQAGGHRFIVVRAAGGFMQHHSTVWNLDSAIAKPVAVLGITWSALGGGGPWLKGARRYDELKKLFESSESLGWAWSDLNNDGTMDPEEFQFIKGSKPILDGFDIKPDLSAIGFMAIRGRIPAPTFTPSGVPVWDLSKVGPLVKEGQPMSDGAPLLGQDNLVLTANGWEMLSNILGYRRDGTWQWSYRAYYQNYIPQFPGQVVMGYRNAGPVMKPTVGEAGEIWCTHGLKGAIYLFTMDGLFLRTLGGDMRTTPLWRMKEARRGLPIENLSFEDEDFGITIQQVQSGEIYLVAGKEHSSILRLDGLETVKRRDWGTIAVTEADLAGLPETIEEWPPKSSRKELDVFTGGAAPTVDGKLDEWAALPPSAWAQLDSRVSAAVRVAGDRLYAAFRTGDPKLLENSADDSRFAFKGGGALDLFLSVGPDNEERSKLNAGDCRLLVTRLKGKPIAVLYRPIGPQAGASEKVSFTGQNNQTLSWTRPGGAGTEPVVFQSPIGKEIFAVVTELSDQLQLAQSGGDYELSIPFHAVIPVPQESWGRQPWREWLRFVVGDLGIIRGNGSQNIQRLCWNNLDTVMVSDIPTEVRLKPRFWGRWNLIPIANLHPAGPAPVAPPAKPVRGLRCDVWELPAAISPEAASAWHFLDTAPTRSKTTERLTIEVRPRDKNYGLRFRGWLTVSAAGWYHFDLFSGHNASRPLLGGQELIALTRLAQADQRHHAVRLAPGTYALELDYLCGERGGTDFALEWSGPGFDPRRLPPEVLSYE